MAKRAWSAEGRPCLRSIVVIAGLSALLPSLLVPASFPVPALCFAPAPASAQIVQGTSILLEVPRLATLGISGGLFRLSGGRIY
jgi:hypothetical protein